jgi:21S rRNA (GM2251-2'-O)-methyltransferase
MELSNKKDEKTAGEILKIAKEKGITIREFPKHDLNMLTENRPHQGFVLRAAPLQFQRIDSLPASDHFECVLALDEVWDPQNFGALLRTSHFLGVDKVVVCAKNSAPLSPAVSKASSGALEVMHVGSTENMMRFLDKSMANGWQVVGTALGDTATNLDQLPLTAPTILVLGNEGHGVRTNILRRCTHLVKIPGAESGDDFGVDSLNVSVTGGILLHHILQAKTKKN